MPNLAPDKSIAHGPRTVEARDGTRLVVWHDGVGPTVLMVHGTTDTHAVWRPVMHRLVGTHSLHALDRRGHGESGDGPHYDLEREFEDIVAVVEALPPPVALVAHSFGAICALGGACLTDRLSHLVLYEPPIAVHDDIYPRELLQSVQTAFDEGRHEDVITTFFTRVVKIPVPLAKRMKQMPEWPGRVARAANLVREMYAVHRFRFDHERHGKIRVPTLVLQGEHSPDFLQAATRMLADGMTNAQLQILPGQRHAAISTAPTLFADSVSNFLRTSR